MTDASYHTAPVPDTSEDGGGALIAADGTPLKQRLRIAMRVSRRRAFLLVAPLLAFILLSFVIPIVALLLYQGVYNDEYAKNMPQSAPLLRAWDGETEPTEEMAAAMVADLAAARESKEIGKVASRVNQELSGTRSLMTKSARTAARMEPPYLQALIDRDKDWGEVETWGAMKLAAQSVTPAFYANAVDARYTATGSFEMQEEERRIYVPLFIRTLMVSGGVTLACVLLGFPVAYLLAHLPARRANLLMILVLLPFWTSLLVRTTAWIAMLQSQGVLNDILVWVGITPDDARFSLIYNMTGTVIAMTHILLPFMILPIYSVMKAIPPSHVRAAKSLGATNSTAFWRVYFPATIPGIGAGGLLVFILAIGYYITPALVGGSEGQLISNMIAYHMQRSLNYSLAAALGGILLIIVLVFYWLYDRVVGIDNMKLG